MEGSIKDYFVCCDCNLMKPNNQIGKRVAGFTQCKACNVVKKRRASHKQKSYSSGKLPPWMFS